MAFSGLDGLKAVAGGMPGGGGFGAGSWRAGQEGGIPPSTTIIIVNTKAHTAGRPQPPPPRGHCYGSALQTKIYEPW